jgi:ubiquinone biosynthesis protein Coq4
MKAVNKTYEEQLEIVIKAIIAIFAMKHSPSDTMGKLAKVITDEAHKAVRNMKR